MVLKHQPCAWSFFSPGMFFSPSISLVLDRPKEPPSMFFSFSNSSLNAFHKVIHWITSLWQIMTAMKCCKIKWSKMIIMRCRLSVWKPMSWKGSKWKEKINTTTLDNLPFSSHRIQVLRGRILQELQIKRVKL